jgi:hypothetical protein
MQYSVGNHFCSSVFGKLRWLQIILSTRDKPSLSDALDYSITMGGFNGTSQEYRYWWILQEWLCTGHPNTSVSELDEWGHAGPLWSCRAIELNRMVDLSGLCTHR